MFPEVFFCFPVMIVGMVIGYSIGKRIFGWFKAPKQDEIVFPEVVQNTEIEEKKKNINNISILRRLNEQLSLDYIAPAIIAKGLDECYKEAYQTLHSKRTKNESAIKSNDLVFKIGLEGEFLAMNKEGVPVDCSKDLPHDAFPFYIEIRSDPGSWETAVATFLNKLQTYKEFCLLNDLTPCFDSYIWDNKMDKKFTTGNWENIYNYGLKNTPYTIGGLHIHFSVQKNGDFLIFDKKSIKNIVEKLDSIFNYYVNNSKGKYRVLGMYKSKIHGFEYRSLPLNHSTLENISYIASKSFNILQKEILQ